MLYRLSYGSNTKLRTNRPARRALYATGDLRTQASLRAILTARRRPTIVAPMSNDDRPSLSEKGRTEADGRARRQAEALRANLARRKAQNRARAVADAESGPCPDADHTVQDPET